MSLTCYVIWYNEHRPHQALVTARNRDRKALEDPELSGWSVSSRTSPS